MTKKRRKLLPFILAISIIGCGGPPERFKETVEAAAAWSRFIASAAVTLADAADWLADLDARWPPQ